MNLSKPLFVGATVVLLWNTAFAEKVFYVAPAGNDTNPGTLQKPFATLQKARDAVRSYNKEKKTDEPITIYLRGGDYFLAQPLLFSPEDSGTESAPISYRAFENEQPIISGGQVIQGWKKKKINKLELWVASLADVKAGTWSFHQLWIGDERRSSCRHPNKGYLKVARVPERAKESQWSDGDTRFGYQGGDLPEGIKPENEIVVMNRWVESRLPIQSVDSSSHMLSFSKSSLFRLDEQDLYYVENSFAALDQPGEWYLDRNKGLLYYYPRPGENLKTVRVIAPRLSQLLLFKGQADSNRYVEHVRWQNITFSHSEWYFPPEFKSEWPHPNAGVPVGGFPQAAVGVPGAVYGEGCRSIILENCRLIHLGGYGVEWAKGCQNNELVRCEIGDLGAGGVKIGEQVNRTSVNEQNSNHGVYDCHIHNGGKVFHSAIGIWIGQSYNNKLIHNHIHDFYYTGISIGWTWGYGESLARGNLVELNHVHHIGVLSDGDGPILSDMAGIYTLGTQPGTIIRLNLFHDIAGLRYGGWGIYFDEGSTYILAENNVVYRTTHGGFHQHYGKENIVRNNIFAYARDFQIQRSRPEPHTSFSFEKNIVYWDSGKLLEGKFKDYHFLFDHNLYWQSKPAPIRFDTLTFASWQSHGMDRHSLLADPMFMDPARDDFRLKPESPAFRLGFEPIPIYKVFQPWNELEHDSTLTPAKSRLLYNQDGTDVFFIHDTTTVQDIHNCVDEVANAGVTTFLISPNIGQVMAYPSKVSALYRYSNLPARPSKADTSLKKINDNLQRIINSGHDPVDLFLRRARLRGMEAFITFRMNELHDVDQPASPLLCEFWKKNPSFRVGGYEGWGASALNYTIPAVRDYYLALLREVCERYLLDGLELDFMRFPFYFPNAENKREEYGRIMTSFVGQVRDMTNQVGRRRNKPILLSARVPSTLKSCAFVGLNVAEWCKNNFIDFLTTAPFLSTETDIPVFEFKAACGDLPVYSGIEYTLGWRSMTPEIVRAVAASLYDYGADGIYIFNYFCSREENMEPDFSVLGEIVCMDSLANKTKLYGMGPAKYPIPDVSMTSVLPLTFLPGQPRAITMRTPEEKSATQVALWLEAQQKLDSDRIFVEFNDQNLEMVSHPDVLFPFNRRVNKPFASMDRVLVFKVPAQWLQSNNQILISSEVKITLDYLYLSVEH